MTISYCVTMWTYIQNVRCGWLKLRPRPDFMPPIISEPYLKVMTKILSNRLLLWDIGQDIIMNL